MWRFVAPVFEDEYLTVLFDFVGAGASDLSAYDPERYGSLDGYAADVIDVVRALDLHDVIFVGHSVSAMIGVLAADTEPDRFGALVLARDGGRRRGTDAAPRPRPVLGRGS
jgi:sigma-B regulation protein RsbQ